MKRIHLFYIIIFILVLSFFLLGYFINNGGKEYYTNSNASLFDDGKQTVIPLNVFQTWKYKELPPKMQESVNTLRRENPEFHYHLFDDNDCREFIQKHFDYNVLYAYDSLIPGAFKADLWRYCVLYVYGGIYLDIKYHTVNGFKLIQLTDKEYFVRDITDSGSGIYNAFMVCKKGNQKMYNCIYKIIDHVNNTFYGNNVFEPTGPLLCLTEFSQDELNELPPIGLSEENCPTKTCISMNNIPIMAIYTEYRDEQNDFFSKENTISYYHLWNERKIYK